MKSLLLVTDLFKEVGGGQTFFRKIIQTNPSITFYYFSKNEKADVPKPSNAIPIPLINAFPPHVAWEEKPAIASIPNWARWILEQCSNFAYSVQGMSFDVIDLPDWEQYGCFLPLLLNHFDVKFKTISISMHGSISTSLTRNWCTEGIVFSALEKLEETQYLTANVQYGISLKYLNEWEKKVGLRAKYLNPFSFLDFPKPCFPSCSVDLPNLVFFGRTEKRKGPDFLVHAAWNLNKKLFNKCLIIGGSCVLHDESNSKDRLQEMVDKRGGHIYLLDGISQKEMQNYFSKPNICVLPSIYDTFNLVALEAIMAGCPVAVGENCGVVDFINNEFPEMPLHVLELEKFTSCLNTLEKALTTIKEDRIKIHQVLSEKSQQRVQNDNLLPIYQEKSNAVAKIPWHFNFMVKLFLAEIKPDPTASLIIPSDGKIPTISHPLKKSFFGPIKELAKHQNKKGIASWKKPIVSVMAFLPRLVRKLRRKGLKKSHYHRILQHMKMLTRLGETQSGEIINKGKVLWQSLLQAPYGKSFLYREISRLSWLRGKPILEAVYLLRAHRFGLDLSEEQKATVKDNLNFNGYVKEGECAKLLLNSNGVGEIGLQLDANRKQFLQNPNYDQDYSILEDRRKKSEYQITIIVSLYNAAERLPFFLDQIARQTVFHNSSAELILVDSASPTDEYQVFLEKIRHLELDAFYCRTASRETIQKAWNRGISFSKGKYLAFLGVDEGLAPEALETLSHELESDPTLDWIQSNSLVTNVNKNGSWVEDVMLYERSGFHPFHIYLETCYISWVGALYRKSLHDRFGYYDDSFRAAGDTEFKCRVGPFVKMKTLPKTLGIFWNYPEERVTQSSLAELEDLRAWYLFRTREGMEYALQGKDQKFIEEVCRLCLKYRKSYLQHWSMDLHLASLVAGILKDWCPNSPMASLADPLVELQNSVEYLDSQFGLSFSDFYSAKKRISTAKKLVRNQLNALELSSYGDLPLNRDNRLEQHQGFWE